MRKIVKEYLQTKGVSMDKPSLGIHVGGYFSGNQQDITFTFDRPVMPEICARMCRNRDEFPNDIFPYHPYIDKLANTKDLPENLMVPITKLLLIAKNGEETMIVVWEESDDRCIKNSFDPFDPSDWQLPGTGGMEVNSFLGSAIGKFQQEQVFFGHEKIVKTEDFQPVEWLPGLSKIRFIDENNVSSEEETVILLNNIETEKGTRIVIVPAIMKGPLPKFDNKSGCSRMYVVFLGNLMRNREFIQNQILRVLLMQHGELLKQLAAG